MPVLPSSTSSTSCGAPASCLPMTRCSFCNSCIKLCFVCNRPAVSMNRKSALRACAAGRLHTKHNLMQELQKLHRVIGKQLAGAPHEVLLVLDATTGMNALNQAREFHKAVPLTGLIVTKLDGTSKGGMVVAIQKELGLPVKFIGLGEQPDDLQPFDAKQFAQALFEE